MIVEISLPSPPPSAIGSFDRGCYMLLKDLVDRRLLCPATQPQTAVSFAVSDLKSRFEHKTREIAMGHTEKVMAELGGLGVQPYDVRIFADCFYSARSPVFTKNRRKRPGITINTMVYYRGTAVRRVVDAGVIDGFACVTMMVDHDLPDKPPRDTTMIMDGIFKM